MHDRRDGNAWSVAIARRMTDRGARSSARLLSGLWLLAALAATIAWVSPCAASTVVELTPAEQTWLKAHPHVRLSFDPAFPPAEFLDEDGRLQGMVADYLALLEQRLGISFQLVVHESWDDALQAARERTVDVLTSVMPTSERSVFLAFTRTHTAFPGVIITQRGADDLTLSDLHGRNVAVVRSYAWEHFIARDHPGVRIERVDDLRTGLMKVSFGQLDAMVANVATASWYIEEDTITNLKVAGETGYTMSMGMGVRKDWPELVGILDKGIASITAEERKAVFEKWVNLEQPGISRAVKLTALVVLALSLTLAGLVSAWNRSLRREVKRQTASLVRKTEELGELARTLDEKVALRTEELKNARETADAANEAKSIFLSSMSHELRTPLNGVLGYAQILQSDRSLGHEQQGLMRSIESCGQHLLTLINDVLDLSKIESGRLEVERKPCHLPQLLDSVVDIVRLRADQGGLAFHFIPDPELPVGILTDPTKLKQILVNLAGNAIKFTDAGSVTLSAGVSSDGDLELVVEDTGIGMTPEEVDLVFEPFAQAEGGRTSGGTGLGLPISRRLAEALSGRLDVESERGRGSRFVLTHPLEEVSVIALDSSSDRPLADHRNLVLPEGREVTVLIVDDVAENRDVLGRLLRGAGFRTLEAENGHRALEELRRQAPALALMDIRMPEMDGYEITRTIRADPELANTVVIGVSASVLDDDRTKALATGFDDFLLKPIQAAQVFDRIAVHLDIAYAQRKEAARPAAVASTAPVRDTVPISARLLLVDDNETNRAVATTLLQQAGYRVDTAVDGRDAVRAVRAGDHDLVLMDLRMPVMDGLEATEAIRALEGPRSNVPILAMTANARDELEGEAALAHFGGWIAKPIVKQDMLESIGAVLSASPPAEEAAPPATQPPPVDEEGGLSVFDARVLAEFADAVGPESFPSLLSMHVSQIREYVGALAGELANDTLDTMGRHAHDLKTSAGSIGAGLLEERARGLERACHEGDAETVAGLLTDVPEMARDALRAVESFETERSRAD